MIGGTLAVFDETLDEPLETEIRHRRNGIDVDDTQQELGGGGPIQSGLAAGTVDSHTQTVSFPTTADGDAAGIIVESEPTRDMVATEWVADPTGTGAIVATSTVEQDPLAFPWDVFTARVDPSVDPVRIDTDALVSRWHGDEIGADLEDVWLQGDTDGDAVQINYHDSADVDGGAGLGVGFKVSWDGALERGVAYESGYVAVYTLENPATFMRFLSDEILPVCGIPVPDDQDSEDQQTLGDVDGGASA